MVCLRYQDLWFQTQTMISWMKELDMSSLQTRPKTLDDYIEVNETTPSEGDNNEDEVAATGHPSLGASASAAVAAAPSETDIVRNFLKDLAYSDEELEKKLADLRKKIKKAMQNIRQSRSSGVSKSMSVSVSL